MSQFGIIEWIYFFFLVIFLIGRCSRLKVTCFSNQSACSGTMNKWAIKLNVQNTDGFEYCAMIIDISFKMKEKSNNRRQNVQGDHFIPRPTLLFHLSMMQRRTHCVRLEVNASKWKFRTAKRMLINRTLLAHCISLLRLPCDRNINKIALHTHDYKLCNFDLTASISEPDRKWCQRDPAGCCWVGI